MRLIANLTAENQRLTSQIYVALISQEQGNKLARPSEEEGGRCVLYFSLFGRDPFGQFPRK